MRRMLTQTRSFYNIHKNESFRENYMRMPRTKLGLPAKAMLK